MPFCTQSYSTKVLIFDKETKVRRCAFWWELHTGSTCASMIHWLLHRARFSFKMVNSRHIARVIWVCFAKVDILIFISPWNIFISFLSPIFIINVLKRANKSKAWWSVIYKPDSFNFLLYNCLILCFWKWFKQEKKKCKDLVVMRKADRLENGRN